MKPGGKSHRKVNLIESSQSIHELFKSRVLPDKNIIELNKMFEDPEYIEKYPEMVQKLINPNTFSRSSIHKSSNFSSNRSNTIQYDDSDNLKTQRDGHQRKRSNQELQYSKRDRSFAKLLKKIQETSKILKATKNGKSIFSTNLTSENGNGNQGFNQTSQSFIPLFTKEELKKDFTKLLELNGPKYPSNQVSHRGQNLRSTIEISDRNAIKIDNQGPTASLQTSQLIYVRESGVNNSSFLNPDEKSIINDINNLVIIQNSVQQLPPLINQQSSSTYDFSKLQSLQPPIGLTSRLSPKQLRQKFQFPEFQDKILDSVRQTGKPKKRSQTNKRGSVILNTQRYQDMNNSLESTVSNKSLMMNNQSIRQTMLVSAVHPGESIMSTDQPKTLPDVIKFCRQENIAFTDSEKMLYDINISKKNHRLYSKCLRHCFKSSYQDEMEIATKSFQRLENVLSRDPNDQQKSIVNNIEDLQNVAKSIKERKELLKLQWQKESQQKRIIQELSLRLDEPTANEKFNQLYRLSGARVQGHSNNQLQSSGQSPSKQSYLPIVQEQMKVIKKSKAPGHFSKDKDKGNQQLSGLQKTQKKMQKSKQRLSKELMKVLEKVDLDRNLTFREKAQAILRESNDQSVVIGTGESPSKDQKQTNASIISKNINSQFQKSNRKLEQSQILEELKKSNKKQLEQQRHCYLMLLEYIKVRQRQDRNSRVSENERKIFDTIKIICEGSWIIKTSDEFIKILDEIGIYKGIDEQTYYFIWYAFELLGFDSDLLDDFISKNFKIDLSFAKQRKSLFNLFLSQQQQSQHSQSYGPHSYQKNQSFSKEVMKYQNRKFIMQEFLFSNMGSRSGAKRKISIGD